MKKYLLLLFALPAFHPLQPAKIDRRALVDRHQVINTRFDTLSSVSVGNGEFAFTVDPTGLQTFPALYDNGVSLGTQTQWAWHALPNPDNYRIEEVYKDYESHGRKVPYTYQYGGKDRKAAVTKYFRENPHRLHLGQIGFVLTKKDGSEATVADLKNIRQVLDLWAGEIRSHFELEGQPVDVRTVSHPTQDLVAADIQSPLLASGRLTVKVHFPYGNTDWEEDADFTKPGQHTTRLTRSGSSEARFERQLDTTRYEARLRWSNGAVLSEKEKHLYVLQAGKAANRLAFSCRFTQNPAPAALPEFTAVKQAANTHWQQFWQTGGAVDLSGSTDPRAKELERRIVLSQYLTAIQCSGSIPPQETGLTYNSWYGKPHLEMHWWHAAHFPLWNRTPLLERSMGWYERIRPQARRLAERQGFGGVRWPKMVDADGNESPSSVAPFLIWQQPHYLQFAELIYQSKPSREVLDRYKNLVFATADFMASYAYFDPETKRYILGKGLIPAQERFKPEETFNPPYELAYWHWGLQTAQKWRQRLGLPRNPDWDKVLAGLSPLPVKDGLYLAAESAPNSYTHKPYMTDHPTVLGAYGYLPGTPDLDKATMLRTFNHIEKVWSWEDTWGWDYPLVAMSATRLGLPDKAVDALLMPVKKNTYLPNGHNYQRDNLRIYLPGNGGLLTAIAFMCAGWEGYRGEPVPGFPKNGKWVVRFENLKALPQ